MSTEPSCPSRKELIALGAGLVSEADVFRIGEHLDQCATCCTAMETLHDKDSIAAALRRDVPAVSLPAGSSVAWPIFEKSDTRHASGERSQSSPRSVPRTGSAISTERLIQILSDCGLMTAPKASEFLESLPAPQRPADGIELAQALVAARKLTAYQAQVVLSGKGQTLLLGNYLVLDKLGQGGMGVVFKAVHRRMNRVVALKVLSPRFGARPEFAQRFQREVQAAAKLSHPHIVKALDAELTGTRRFLVMEYVAGIDLSVLVKKRGKLPVQTAIDLVLQAARGLEYAHSRGIVHRDVKPSNLLREFSGTVKLLDLGLARMASAAGGVADLTSTGAVMGTVDFMAPEQAADTKHADARADVYSLGITLWYLLTGRIAYEGGTAMSKLLSHRDAPVPSLTAARTDASPELDRLFQKMAAKRPEQRHASMTEVIADLEHCLKQFPPTDEDLHFFDRQSEVETDAEIQVLIGTGRATSESAEESTLTFHKPDDEHDTQSQGLALSQSADSTRVVETGRPRSHTLLRSLAAAGAVAVAAAGVWLIRGQFAAPAAEAGKVASELSAEGDQTEGVSPTTDGAANPSANEASKSTTVSGAPSSQNKPSAKVTVTGGKTSPPAEKAAESPAAAVKDLTAARTLLAELDQKLADNPSDMAAFSDRMLLYKRLGMWGELTVEVERMAELQPEYSILRMPVAYIGGLAGDLEAYRRTCRLILDKFGKTNALDDLERACKVPLFITGEFQVSDLPVKKLEELIRQEAPITVSSYWGCVSRAYVACHARQPDLALEWLAKRQAPRTAYHVYTYSQFVRAQALQQLDRKAEARAAFDDGVSLMPADLARRLDNPEEPQVLLPVDSVHGDWLILSLVRRQTQALLEK